MPREDKDFLNLGDFRTKFDEYQMRDRLKQAAIRMVYWEIIEIIRNFEDRWWEHVLNDIAGDNDEDRKIMREAFDEVFLELASKALVEKKLTKMRGKEV